MPSSTREPIDFSERKQVSESQRFHSPLRTMRKSTAGCRTMMAIHTAQERKFRCGMAPPFLLETPVVAVGRGTHRHGISAGHHGVVMRVDREGSKRSESYYTDNHFPKHAHFHFLSRAQ